LVRSLTRTSRRKSRAVTLADAGSSHFHYAYWVVRTSAGGGQCTNCLADAVGDLGTLISLTRMAAHAQAQQTGDDPDGIGDSELAIADGLAMAKT
jgi:hypothetical protein